MSGNKSGRPTSPTNSASPQNTATGSGPREASVTTYARCSGVWPGTSRTRMCMSSMVMVSPSLTASWSNRQSPERGA